MMLNNFLLKLKFWHKPKIVILGSDNQEMVKKIVSQIVSKNFSVDKEVLFVDNLEKIDLSKTEYLILNLDNIKKPEIKKLKVITFGFQWNADFQVSDIKQTSDYTNFKINYQGNVVPIWLEGAFAQKEISAVLTAIIIGTIFNLNLVEISQKLKSPHRLEA